MQSAVVRPSEARPDRPRSAWVTQIPRSSPKPSAASSPANTSGASWRRPDKAKDESGGIGALLRREGLYSSHLTTWRHERAAGILQSLTPQKRGPKSKRNPLDDENQKLQRENQHLREELRKAEIVI